MRRRGRVEDAVEKFSVVKTMQAIEDANVVVLVLDGSEKIVDQDAHIAGYVLDAGRALVVAVNKWDNLDVQQREWAKQTLARTLNFMDFAGESSHLRAGRNGNCAAFCVDRTRLPVRHGQAGHAQIDACADGGRRAPGTAAGGHVPSENALCPSGRQQSAARDHSRQQYGAVRKHRVVTWNIFSATHSNCAGHPSKSIRQGLNPYERRHARR